MITMTDRDNTCNVAKDNGIDKCSGMRLCNSDMHIKCIFYLFSDCAIILKETRKCHVFDVCCESTGNH